MTHRVVADHLPDETSELQATRQTLPSASASISMSKSSSAHDTPGVGQHENNTRYDNASECEFFIIIINTRRGSGSVSP